MNDRPYAAADDAIAFPTLADSELAVLEALGTRRPVAAGRGRVSLSRGGLHLRLLRDPLWSSRGRGPFRRRGADRRSPRSWAS